MRGNKNLVGAIYSSAGMTRFFSLLEGPPFSASGITPPSPCRENPDI